MATIYSAEIAIAKKSNINYKKILGESKEHQRSKVKIEESKDKVTISIETEDLAALRASINAVTRDIQVIENSGNSK